MKGPEVSSELEQARGAAEKLSGAIVSQKSLILPDGSERVLVVVKKISQTSPRYPRKGKDITKTPLK